MAQPPGYGPPAYGPPGSGAGAPSYGGPGYGGPAYGPPPDSTPPAYGSPPESAPPGYGASAEYGPSSYGAPPTPPPNRPVGLIVGAIIAVAVLVMIAGGVIAAVYVSNRGSSDDPTVASSDGPTSATTGEAPASSAPSADSTVPAGDRGTIGKPVRQADLIITVTAKPQCGVKSIGSGYTTYEPRQGQWCLIDLKFENVGKAAIKPRQSSIKMIDENGGEYLMDLFSFKANPDDNLALFENIYQGKTATGIIAFDVATGQVPATLKMNPAGDWDDELQFSLK
ncbi:DUF4352 domain-containing protein [Cryptosporangium phraense]|uniref:DUF4352 domain-containing protein n=1 Tax=Cryptosporangium phraense TaxID=2593070 RepID=A0A545AHA9_9ACTN|nr:DUF4352 domain-containing protein [Cryptosporangium phraense]TQS40708.1 DUF4352 domain-containing protein [Cryptosporangium phraense]